MIRKIAELTPDENLELAETIAQVCNPDHNVSLPLIEAALQKLDTYSLEIVEIDTWRQAFQGLWKFYKGIKLVLEKAEYFEAQALLQDAIVDFQNVGHEEFYQFARGFECYITALLEVQSNNISKGLELMNAVKEHFNREGRFSGCYEPFLERLSVDIFALAAMQAYNNFDFDSVKGYFGSASKGAEKIAREIEDKESSDHFMYLGLSHYYKAISKGVWVFVQFNEFAYDAISKDHDLAFHAKRAIEYLSQGDKNNKIVSSTLSMAQGMVEVLEVILELSIRMEAKLNSTIKPTMESMDHLKSKMNTGIEYMTHVGPNALPLIRLCNGITHRINNLERLGKPNTKDFGVFSGMITSGSFVILFLIMALINYFASLNLEPKYLIGVPLVLALICGFGYGAMKFKNLFPWFSKAEEN